MRGGRGVRGDAHEIHAFVEIHALDNLIRVAHLPVVRRTTRQQRHRELWKPYQPPVTHQARCLGFRGDQLDAIPPG